MICQYQSFAECWISDENVPFPFWFGAAWIWLKLWSHLPGIVLFCYSRYFCQRPQKYLNLKWNNIFFFFFRHLKVDAWNWKMRFIWLRTTRSLGIMKINLVIFWALSQSCLEFSQYRDCPYRDCRVRIFNFSLDSGFRFSALTS